MSKRTFREPQVNPIDPVPGGAAGLAAYKSYQKIINSNNGKLNEDRLEEHLEMMRNDPYVQWEDVEPIDFSTLNKGDRIRYISRLPGKTALFRTGGWITAIDEDNYEWLAYMAHTKSSWTVQAEDCIKMWVVRKKESNKPPKDDTIYFKPLKEQTNFKVTLPNRIRELPNSKYEEIVYYAKDNYDKKRFESTNKYKNAKNGERWDFK